MEDTITMEALAIAKALLAKETEVVIISFKDGTLTVWCEELPMFK